MPNNLAMRRWIVIVAVLLAVAFLIAQEEGDPATALPVATSSAPAPTTTTTPVATAIPLFTLRHIDYV